MLTGKKTSKRLLVYGEKLARSYQMGADTVTALRGVTFGIDVGDFVALAGPSGSGKTTLLNIIGCIERPSKGKIALDGLDLSTLSPDDLADLRAESIGYIFQNFNLLPILSALENVEYPLVIRKIGAQERRRRALAALESVGLSNFIRHKPMELSGGQRQRVAIARAIVGLPMLVIADEPTANLDQNTGHSILELMKELNNELGITFIVATHDSKVMDCAKRIIRINDGLIVGNAYAGNVASIEARH